MANMGKFLYALYLRRLEIAKYLLDKAKYDIHGYYPCYVKDNGNGIDVRQYNEDRITPAYLAVVLNDPISIETLIEWGADVNKPSWLAKPVFVSPIIERRHGYSSDARYRTYARSVSIYL